MPTTIRFALSYLDDFDQQWILSVAGAVNQRLRADILTQARNYLAKIESNPISCIRALDGNASDIHNYRSKGEECPIHLQLRLRMFALISWLLEHGDETTRTSIASVATRRHCPEISAILAGELIK